MKKTRLKIIAGLLLIGIMSACDSFFDINVSPNLAAAVPARTLMASVTGSVGFHMGSDIHRFSSIYAQQFTGGGAAGTQTVEYSRYNVTATDVNNVWRGALYGNLLADLEQLRLQTQETSPYYAGIAKILQAYVFAIAVDAFGNVPYTEALKFAGNTKPRYDDSRSIYDSLFGLIDAGIADLRLTTSVFTPATDDLIYAGNLSRWIRFANSLKIRMYVKYYPADAAFANAGIAALLADVNSTFISANTENFSQVFEALANRQNPIDQFERSRQSQFWPTTSIVDRMNATSDPRRTVYYRETSPGVFSGLAPGSQITSPSTSRMHTYLRGATTSADPIIGYTGSQPLKMLTFAEHNFNLAEYYLRTSQIGLAQTAFQAGVTASFADAGAALGTYITINGTLNADPTIALRQIITEKYIANYGVAMEPWSDWRRTGFPLLNPAVDAVLNVIPRILPYSDLERVTNPENTPVRTTEDLKTSQVFWDPAN